MGKYLDIDDVAAGNPVAERELAELREQATIKADDVIAWAYRVVRLDGTDAQPPNRDLEIAHSVLESEEEMGT